TASANPATVGQPVTFKVSVTPSGDSLAVASGSVTLSEDCTVIGTAVFSATGEASFIIPTLTVGAHTLTANYAGSTSFSPATGTLVETVKALPTPKVSITASANPATVGQPVTLKVSVTSGDSPLIVVSGSVTLSEGATVIRTAVLASGEATFTIPTLTVGAHTFTATYSGSTL